MVSPQTVFTLNRIWTTSMNCYLICVLSWTEGWSCLFLLQRALTIYLPTHVRMWVCQEHSRSCIRGRKWSYGTSNYSKSTFLWTVTGYVISMLHLYIRLNQGKLIHYGGDNIKPDCSGGGGWGVGGGWCVVCFCDVPFLKNAITLAHV